MASGSVDNDGYPIPLDDRTLHEPVESCTRGTNAFEEAPADTDLNGDSTCGPHAKSTMESSAWVRTSSPAFLALIADVPVNLVAAVRYNLTAKKPSHVVVFGADVFHLCSCLKLVRHGLLCRYYSAVLLRFIVGKHGGVLLRHDSHGSSVRNCWRKSPDANDEPWTVSMVLDHTGHGNGWDGCVAGDDDNYWGPTFDDPNNEEGAHPSERAVQAAEERQASDQLRELATVMARSKDNVGEILRTVLFAKALEIQVEVDKLVKFHLHDPSGGSKARSSSQALKKGRPKGKKGCTPVVPPPTSNPEGRHDKSRRGKRVRDGLGAGSGRSGKSKKKKKNVADS